MYANQTAVSEFSDGPLFIYLHYDYTNVLLPNENAPSASVSNAVPTSTDMSCARPSVEL